jgi:UDP:flavonoid glycosyltransferase YjiC (YdhE family)
LKVLLTTIGSSGDINPFIAVGRALRDRGHEATLLVNPFFESGVRQAGLGYLPLGEELDTRKMSEIKDVAHARKGGIVVLREFLLPYMREMHDLMTQAIEAVRPDVVLLHQIALGAQWACERRGVPFATGVLSPSLWLNPDSRPIFGAMPDTLPIWVMRAGLWVGKMQCRAQLDRPVNRVRRELGYPDRLDQFFNNEYFGARNLGMWSPVMRPPMDGDPANGRICGFPWHDRFERFEEKSAEVLRYFDECERAGEPPIIFTLGTAVVHVAGRFYHDAAEAARRLGRRAVLITNRPDYAPAAHELPAGVKAFPYAPYSQILPRAACTVHHGGIGSTAQGLRSGRPTVIVPHAYDQFDNAARARRLGVSATVYRSRVSPETLVKALRAVLEDPSKSEKAADVGKRLAGEDGAVVAAEELEKLAGMRCTDSAVRCTAMASSEPVGG